MKTAESGAGRPIEHLAASIVMDVPLDALTLDQTMKLIRHFVDEGRRSGRSFQIATVNVDFLANAAADTDVLQMLQDADLCIADGMPIVWASRLQRMPLPERVTGADLVPAIVAAAAIAGYRVLLFGSAEGVAEQAATILGARFPGAHVYGVSGPFLPSVSDMAPEVLEEIRAYAADIICVALGNPKQERWIKAFRHELDIPVLIGVGGTLDFLVGGRRRAPRWAQRLGLEWIFRGAQEPKRLGKRYVRDAIVFGPLIAGLAWHRITRRGPAERHACTVDPSNELMTINIVEGAQPTAAALAEVVSWARHSRRTGTAAVLTGVTDAWRGELTTLGVDRTINIADQS